MSLWPVKVEYDVTIRRTETVFVDYDEFAEWSGTTLHDSDGKTVADYLWAGDEIEGAENLHVIRIGPEERAIDE